MAAHNTKAGIRSRMILAMAIAAIGLTGGATSACAGPDPVDLKVVDRDTGRPLQVWSRHGRLFVAGQPGARYSLRVTNHTGGRVLVVMSVDGVNILSGETADYDQRGYVFAPYESYEVTGWRKSNTEVAAFAFAPLPQSYAARTGRPGDVGVIGMAVFKEKVDYLPPQPEASASWRARREDRSRGHSDTARSPVLRRAPGRKALLAPVPPPPPSLDVPAPIAAPAAPATEAQDYSSAGAAAQREEKLGTAHGEREWSVVNIVDFQRATPYPQFIRQIEYDTYANLVASGVIPRTPRDREPHPRPFPSNPDGAGYVPDPPGWE